MDDGEMANLFGNESDNSVENFLEELWKNTHSCTHTHTCNPPGPDNTHTHTCTHTHTQLFASLDGKAISAEAQNIASSDHHSPSEPSSSSFNQKKPQQSVGNREAVRKYREKKKAQTAHLEEEVSKLRATNQQLMKKLQGKIGLEQEVVRLRRILAEFRGRIDGEIGPTSLFSMGRSQISDGDLIGMGPTSSLLCEGQMDGGDLVIPASSCRDPRIDDGDAIMAVPSSLIVCPDKINSGDLASCKAGQRYEINGGDLAAKAMPTSSSLCRRGQRSSQLSISADPCVVYKKEMGPSSIRAPQPPPIVSDGHHYLNSCNVECHTDVPCVYSSVLLGDNVEQGPSTPQEHSSLIDGGSSLSRDVLECSGNYSLRSSSKRTKRKE